MATEFRPLNENETHALNRAIEKGEIGPIEGPGHTLANTLCEELLVSYERLSGGFCVCIILHTPKKRGRVRTGLADRSYVLRGASRQSIHDRPNRIKGDMLAFNRAIRDSKPVEVA